MGVNYHRVDPRRMTVGECLGMVYGLGKRTRLLAARVGLPVRSGLRPAVVLTRWPAVEADDLPDGMLDAVRPALDDLTGHGYRIVTYGRWPLGEQDREIGGVLFVSADRRTGGVLNWLRIGADSGGGVSLTTRFADGTFGVSTNLGCHFRPPPGLERRVCLGVIPRALHWRHQRHINGWVEGGRVPVPFADHEAAPVSITLGREQEAVLVERGVLVPMTDDEVRAYRESPG